MNLSLSRIHYPITSLGPGNRIGIWFQGCSIQCPGCISTDTWAFGSGATTVDELMRAVEPWLGDADGVTISGGEPFDQATQLHAVLKELRSRSKSDILVYSGYAFEEIEHLLAEMSGLIDALITEPFRIAETQSLPLRGSDNQVLRTLTDLGSERFSNSNLEFSAQTKRLDIMFDDNNSVWIAGIPQRGELQQISRLLLLQGFESVTSEQGGGNH